MRGKMGRTGKEGIGHRVIGVIPARYGSSRFPGKPLAPILGKPMIQWVYERASRSKRLERLVVATDDDRIAAAVSGFGGEVVMTGKACASGMDRCAEVASSVPCGIVVDIQGDEPLLMPELLDRLVASLDDAPWASIATPYRRCESVEEYRDPDRVKVVLGIDERILYFSRSPIPHGLMEPAEGAFIHVGIYAFRQEALMALRREPRGELEMAESLEQLRVLEAGMAIRGLRCEGTFVGVDRPGDIGLVEEVLRRERRG